MKAKRGNRKKAYDMKHNAETAYNDSAVQFNRAAKCYIEDALSDTFINNDANKATNSFQKSSELYGNSGASYTNQAKLLDSLGNKKEAELAYEKSSKEYQKSANIYNILALYNAKEAKLFNNLENKEEANAYKKDAEADNNER